MPKKDKGKVSTFFSRLFRALFNSSTKYEVSKNNWKDEEGHIGSLAATAGHNMVLEKLDKMPIMPGTKRVPGATGIPNNGNTCYLNAVIQCLSNTSQFSDLICREFCRGGEITAQTSALIRTLWLGEPAGKAAQSLIGTVVRLNPQIEFDVQQDAQEFLLWMLTMLHEDLREDKNGLSRRNMARNSFRRIKNLRKKYALAPLPTSPIERFFGGNYCQSIVCPVCKKPKQSSELFLTLSLPIPVESKKTSSLPDRALFIRRNREDRRAAEYCCLCR